MAAKPHFIRVSSQKGGVGKTVVSVNLALALGAQERKVLLVDEDLTNPSATIHLKLESVSVGIKDVLSGSVTVDKAIVKYIPGRIDVLPGVISGKESSPSPITDDQVDKFGVPLLKSNYEFIIVDTSPGILAEKLLQYYNEALLVTTPDMPSLASLMKLSGLYTGHGLKTNFVVNRVTKKRHEITGEEIEKVVKQKALASLPEDPEVTESVEKQIPLYLNNDDAPFSREIDMLAKHYVKRFI